MQMAYYASYLNIIYTRVLLIIKKFNGFFLNIRLIKSSLMLNYLIDKSSGINI